MISKLLNIGILGLILVIIIEISVLVGAGSIIYNTFSEPKPEYNSVIHDDCVVIIGNNGSMEICK